VVRGVGRLTEPVSNKRSEILRFEEFGEKSGSGLEVETERFEDKLDEVEGVGNVIFDIGLVSLADGFVTLVEDLVSLAAGLVSFDTGFVSLAAGLV
jgi:hypothetical protein